MRYSWLVNQSFSGRRSISGLLVAAFAASGAANANITTETTINFNTTNWLGTSGFANTAPGTCGTGAAACYSQNGMVVGIVEDKSEFGDDSHIHKENGTTPPDRFVKFEADSSGI